MKRILVFGAGKSATCLIDFLIAATAVRGWELLVADLNFALAQSKTGDHSHVKAVSVKIEDDVSRARLIQSADIVLSLLPPSLHYLVARECIMQRKNLLNASYVDGQIRAMESEIRDAGLLFLCEMGLDPGIDHMSAMDLLTRIKERGATITSFKSHTGGLVAPPSDDNPWHYKISWNPRNVVRAGSAGATWLENGKEEQRTYHELFSSFGIASVPTLPDLAWYPNRDSLSYIDLYKVHDAATFIRTTMRYPEFCRYWEAIVKSGLTDDIAMIDPVKLSFRSWSAPIAPFVNRENSAAFEYLGLFDETIVPQLAATNADVLQYLLETKLAMRTNDQDMIVMLHEVQYQIENSLHAVSSSLVVYGEDSSRTAMAKTVGLPLGIAAILILEEKIQLTGVHIPIVPEIYKPVLSELERYGIKFQETLVDLNT